MKYCTGCGAVHPLHHKDCIKNKNGDFSGTLNSLVVPKALWDRMSAIVINVKNSPVRHAGTSCYDSGLFDKRTIDDLIDDIKRHNT